MTLTFDNKMKKINIAAFAGIVTITIFAVYYPKKANPDGDSSTRLLVPDQSGYDEVIQSEATSEVDPFSESNHSVYDQTLSEGQRPKQIATSGGPNPRMMTWYFEGGSRTEMMDFDVESLFGFEHSDN
jgi:hypothetical protein